MTTINLKDFYSWYTHDEYIEVSDEVAAELRAIARGAGRRVRKDFSNTEDERSTPTPQVGTCHPTATIREWTGWQPVPRSCRTTPARSVAPSIAVL